MNKIYEIINTKTDDKYKSVRFSSIKFDAAGSEVTVVCMPNELEKYKRSESELAALLKDVCKFNLPLRVSIKPQDTAITAIRADVARFVSGFPYVGSITNDITVDCEGADIVVKLKMHERMHALAKDDFIPRLKDYLESAYITPIKTEVDITRQAESNNEVAAPVIHALKSDCSLKNVTPVFGDITSDIATPIENLSANADGVTTCGIFAMPTEFLSKGGGVKRSRPYEKFVLYNGESIIHCRYFPRDGHTAILPELLNVPVCVYGNVVVDSRECTITVSALAKVDCDIQPIQVKPAPKEYVTVSPKPYTEYVQASLFDQEEKLPKALKGSFVVFDFETTGLTLMYDRPTEIGAVKIVNGVITETFTTLIDPQRPIPEVVSKKTGITDEMVKGKPLFADVLPDFYKFSYGCALVGHNIAFDFPYLLKYGNRFGWTFSDRLTYDTMGLAPRALPGIDVLTLDRVIDTLGIVNDSAHRALADATATAKAFIAMQKRIHVAKSQDAAMVAGA